MVRGDPWWSVFNGSSWSLVHGPWSAVHGHWSKIILVISDLSQNNRIKSKRMTVLSEHQFLRRSFKKNNQGSLCQCVLSISLSLSTLPPHSRPLLSDVIISASLQSNCKPNQDRGVLANLGRKRGCFLYNLITLMLV